MSSSDASVIPSSYWLTILVVAVLGLLLVFKGRAFGQTAPVVPPEKTASSAMKHELRDTFYGDLPLDEWGGDGKSSPWNLFVEAGLHLKAGQKEAAVASLKQVLSLPDLEARHYLQAWHFLRPLGHLPPPEEAQKVLGVVVEVPMKGGLDLLAAYPDHSARYYNFSGSGVVWEHADTSLDAAIDKLISAAADVVPLIGPWKGERPAAPSGEEVRLSFLTPGGLCFGQGTFQDLSADPKGSAVVNAATELMRALMAKYPAKAK